MAKQWIEAMEGGISKDEGEETNNPNSIRLGCVENLYTYELSYVEYEYI